MKSKGFTLIELLAVIVILAIIALIATPIVLGIIDDSRQSSNKISAGYIIDAFEKAYSIALAMNSGAVPTTEQIKENFDMTGAIWTQKDGKDVVQTTNGEVVCPLNIQGTSLSVSCGEDYPDAFSETMEISSNVGA